MEQARWEALPLSRVPTQARSRDKVERALAAAERLVRAEGPEAITLPRVADEAGLSVGALYQYLPDRDAIVRTVIARYHARLEAALRSAVEAASAAHPDPDPDPVGAIIRAVAAIYQDEELARALRAARAGAAADADSADHKARMATLAAALLRAHGLAGSSDDAHLAVVARVAFLGADAVMHEAFAAPEAERAALLAELERTLRASLGA